MYWLATRHSSWRVPAQELVVWSSHQRNPGRAEVQSRHCWAESYTTENPDVNEQAQSFSSIIVGDRTKRTTDGCGPNYFAILSAIFRHIFVASRFSSRGQSSLHISLSSGLNGAKLRAVWDVFCPAGAWPKGSRKHSPGLNGAKIRRI